MHEVIIREARREDASRLLEIYAYYIENTAITFEYTVPSLKEFQNRIQHIQAKYPYLVIEKAGRIEGYAYAGVFNERAAYDWCCELSIYLDHHAQRQGLGRQLYAALETKLKKMGIINCYACIAYPQQEDTYLNDHSARFHEHLGFQTVGYFHQCGYKFGHWYDMIWMERMIGEHPDKVDPVRFSRS